MARSLLATGALAPRCGPHTSRFDCGSSGRAFEGFRCASRFSRRLCGRSELPNAHLATRGCRSANIDPPNSPLVSSFAFLHHRDDPDFRTSAIDLTKSRGLISPRCAALAHATLQKPNRALHSLIEAPASSYDCTSARLCRRRRSSESERRTFRVPRPMALFQALRVKPKRGVHSTKPCP